MENTKIGGSTREHYDFYVPRTSGCSRCETEKELDIIIGKR